MSNPDYITLPLPNDCFVVKDPNGLASLTIPADEAARFARNLLAEARNGEATE